MNVYPSHHSESKTKTNKMTMSHDKSMFDKIVVNIIFLNVGIIYLT